MRSFDLNAGEERTTFMTWQKALFDPSSEGIEDSIFRFVDRSNALDIDL
jgi:hypothetical protein